MSFSQYHQEMQSTQNASLKPNAQHRLMTLKCNLVGWLENPSPPAQLKSHSQNSATAYIFQRQPLLAVFCGYAVECVDVSANHSLLA